MRTSSTFRRPCLLVAAAALGAWASSAQAVPIVARITADNSYRLGFGPPGGPATFGAAINNQDAASIFTCSTGPESTSIAPNADDFIYVAANDDESGTQGLLGQFSLPNGATLGTGPDWEVCAVGANTANPPVATLNSDILRCNNGDPALTSRGWVGTSGSSFGKLKVGEPNDATAITGNNVLPQVCTTSPNGIDAQARWIWYDRNSASPDWPATAAPFRPSSDGGAEGEYLIFRLQVRRIPEVCTRIQVTQQYAVKFACFQAVEEPLALVSGFYGTAINVHEPRLPPAPNVRIRPINLAKKVSIALPAERVGPMSPYHLQRLTPGNAFEIDCQEIRRIAGAPATFFTGFVVIDSDAPLDVTAIYTARPANAQVSTMDVEIIPARPVEGSLEVCQ